MDVSPACDAISLGLVHAAEELEHERLLDLFVAVDGGRDALSEDVIDFGVFCEVVYLRALLVRDSDLGVVLLHRGDMVRLEDEVVAGAPHTLVVDGDILGDARNLDLAARIGAPVAQRRDEVLLEYDAEALGLLSALKVVRSLLQDQGLHVHKVAAHELEAGLAAARAARGLAEDSLKLEDGGDAPARRALEARRDHFRPDVRLLAHDALDDEEFVEVLAAYFPDGQPRIIGQVCEPHAEAFHCLCELHLGDGDLSSLDDLLRAVEKLLCQLVVEFCEEGEGNQQDMLACGDGLEELLAVLLVKELRHTIDKVCWVHLAFLPAR